RQASSRERRFEFAGFRMDSPLGIAAGFDKNATMALGLWKMGFGFVEVGTVTPRPQKGNPRPRLFRLEDSEALINRMGFNNAGADAMLERLRHLRAMERLEFPLGINFGKNRDTPLECAADDYVHLMRTFYPWGDYFVVNLSSPNTPGLTGLQEGEHLVPLLRRVREARDESEKRAPGPLRPLFLKVSPDLTDEALRFAVDAALAEGFQGIIAGNTTRRRDLPGIASTDQRLLAQEGGLSGAPLREEAFRNIGKLRSWMGPKPWLISAGGLGGGDDARRRLEAGAHLLQVYTSFVYRGPFYPRQIAQAFRL
ncbi:MAG: quinone-dependent dihydroorotate dehydrogenase, partial [Bdellovibrionales bacterium]|nr:quinone-dependent dihydroorotate dehydrogenase [Bdellovibrionales bacterium]